MLTTALQRFTLFFATLLGFESFFAAKFVVTTGMLTLFDLEERKGKHSPYFQFLLSVLFLFLSKLFTLCFG